jgi:hypothetical protein
MRSVSNSTLVIYGSIPENSSTHNTGTGTFPDKRTVVKFERESWDKNRTLSGTGNVTLHPVISTLIQQYAEKSKKLFQIRNAYQCIKIFSTIAYSVTLSVRLLNPRKPLVLEECPLVRFVRVVFGDF